MRSAPTNEGDRQRVKPLLGSMSVGRLEAEVLDSFYADLARCRDHCDQRPYVERRWTTRKHNYKAMNGTRSSGVAGTGARVCRTRVSGRSTGSSVVHAPPPPVHLAGSPLTELAVALLRESDWRAVQGPSLDAGRGPDPPVRTHPNRGVPMRRSATFDIAGHRVGWRAVMCVAAAALAPVALSVTGRRPRTRDRRQERW